MTEPSQHGQDAHMEDVKAVPLSSDESSELTSSEEEGSATSDESFSDEEDSEGEDEGAPAPALQLPPGLAPDVAAAAVALMAPGAGVPVEGGLGAVAVPTGPFVDPNTIGGPRETEYDSSPLASSSEDEEEWDMTDGEEEEADIDYPDDGDVEEVWKRVGQLYRVEDEDEDEGPSTKGPPRTKNEVVELPPPEEVTAPVPPQEELVLLGSVTALVDGTIVIQAAPGSRPVGEGTLLCLEDRRPLGKVEETFGPVLSPFYSLRYGGPKPMPSEVKQGAQVYAVKGSAEFLVPEKLKSKGYDASGLHDEELSGAEAGFSDDDQEQEHKRKLKQKKRKGGEEEGAAGLQAGDDRGGRGRGRGRGGEGGRGSQPGGRGGRGGGRYQGPQAQQFLQHDTNLAQQQLAGMGMPMGGGDRSMQMQQMQFMAAAAAMAAQQMMGMGGFGRPPMGMGMPPPQGGFPPYGMPAYPLPPQQPQAPYAPQYAQQQGQQSGHLQPRPPPGPPPPQ